MALFGSHHDPRSYFELVLEVFNLLPKIVSEKKLGHLVRGLAELTEIVVNFRLDKVFPKRVHAEVCVAEQCQGILLLISHVGWIECVCERANSFSQRFLHILQLEIPRSERC